MASILAYALHKPPPQLAQSVGIGAVQPGRVVAVVGSAARRPRR
jgi:hypothetical protein